MIKKTFNRWLQTAINMFCYPFIRYEVSPNLITIVGAIMMVVAAVLLAVNRPGIAFTVFAVGAVFDALDGTIARRLGKCSTFGAFLDSTLDRITEIMLAVGYLFYFNVNNAFGMSVVLWIIAVITSSLMVSYVRARAEGLGLSCKIGLVQRTTRGVILGLAILTCSPKIIFASIVVVTCGNIITVLQRILWVLANADKQTT